MRAALIALVAFVPALAMGDVIHLADGTRREGRVVETTQTEVVVDVGVGNVSLMVRLPRADVVRIEHKASVHDVLMADYARRLTQAQAGGADGWYGFGVWCVEQRVLKEQARAAFERAVAADPDHAQAHAALGHVKLNDAWMTRDRAIAVLAPEVTEAAVTARQEALAARKEAEQAQVAALEAQKQLTELQAQLDQLKKENESLRIQLAAPPPPPPRPRVIYRPIFIRPPRKKPSTDRGSLPKAKAPATSTQPAEGKPPEAQEDEGGE